MATISKGIDYAWGKPGGKKIKSAGYEFVCRYLSLNATKNITCTEAADLHANDLKIVLVWETTEQRPLKGRQAGIDDATKAKQQAKTVGWPDDKAIYFACDFDFTEPQQHKINEYFEGVATVLPLEQIGVYGGYGPVKRLLDAGLVTYAWQTAAWSHGKWDERIHLKQIKFGIKIGGVSTDINDAVKEDFGQW